MIRYLRMSQPISNGSDNCDERLSLASIRRMAAKVVSSVLALVFAGLVAGCHTIRETAPPRTATEELLLSTAADRAVTNEDFSWLKGKRVFLEDKYFESYDKGYVVGLIRQCLSEAGALLTATNTQAEFMVEIRSGALSINSSETLFGIPAATAPVPLTGAIQTPEVAFYKSQKDDSISKFALYAYRRESGNFVQAVGPMTGGAYFHLYKILGMSWKRTDVPELKHPPKSTHPAGRNQTGQ